MTCDSGDYGNCAFNYVNISASGTRLYLAGNDCALHTYDLDTGAYSILAGQHRVCGYVEGIGTDARFGPLWTFAMSPDESAMYLADHNNDVVRKLDMSTLQTSTVLSKYRSRSIAVSPDGDFLYMVTWYQQGITRVALKDNNQVTELDPFGFSGGCGGIVASHDGNYLYLAKAASGNPGALLVRVATNDFSTYTDMGANGCNAAHCNMAISADGQTLFIGEKINGCIQTKSTAGLFDQAHVAGTCGAPCSAYDTCVDGLADGVATFFQPHAVTLPPAAGVPIWVPGAAGSLRVIAHQ